ncbi:hypothetical protein NQ318_018654 [Aromia moschata]|uniref:Uncharacterized protein n=1 Tax=Aromia moschata TaxID=1265417 RepID=A0AAV8ZFV7_9CUCU|nr:hypothetical protein NQ318_018654 [Aromia moschata]
MEQQMDTLKVYKHFQHARLQTEDDFWISSEDLRTEGSSDEDTQHKSRTHKTRTKKSKRTEALNESKDVFSIVPKFSNLAALADKEASCSSAALPVQMESCLRDKDPDLTSCRLPSTASKLSPDCYLDNAPSTSGISLGSSDAGMDALNLESRWRPKRGSLKYPILVEGTSVEV